MNARPPAPAACRAVLADRLLFGADAVPCFVPDPVSEGPCGDVSNEAHERAVQRMVHAGVKPVTAVQYILELQRDWARTETYEPVTTLMKKYGAGYGIGIQYAHKMIKH